MVSLIVPTPTVTETRQPPAATAIAPHLTPTVTEIQRLALIPVSHIVLIPTAMGIRRQQAAMVTAPLRTLTATEIQQ